MFQVKKIPIFKTSFGFLIFYDSQLGALQTRILIFSSWSFQAIFQKNGCFGDLMVNFHAPGECLAARRLEEYTCLKQQDFLCRFALPQFSMDLEQAAPAQ